MTQEQELMRRIEEHRREQYLATRDIVVKAEARVRDAERRRARVDGISELEMHSKNRDIIYGIADRNRRIYEYKIDRLNDKIKLLRETDETRIQAIRNATRIKTAYYKLVADHTATPYDVRRHIYERIPSPTGKYELGLLQRTRRHMTNLPVCKHDLENLQVIYTRVLFLYDLGLKDCIADFYEQASVLPKEGAIGEFVDLYKTVYLIPEQLRRFRLRAKLFRHLPLCDDVICEIFAFMCNGTLCDRKMIDAVVYA